MKVVITGGTGFIGSSLVIHFLDKGEEVYNVSKHTYATNFETLKEKRELDNYHEEQADLTNQVRASNILRGIEPDLLFHLAASTHVDRSFKYPEEFLRTNVQGTFNVLEALKDLNTKMVYLSTDEVFGDVPLGHKCTEDEITEPQNPYSASKRSAECYCQAYYHSFDVPVTILRSMNAYGPRQHPEKLISKIITNCIEGKNYTLYKGDAIRGWLYVQDVCEALDFVGSRGERGEIYHVPAKDYLSVPEVNEIILGKMGSEDIFGGFQGRRLKDDERYALKGDKLRDLGWEPSVSFKEGIEKTVKWFEENEWFWKNA